MIETGLIRKTGPIFGWLRIRSIIYEIVDRNLKNESQHFVSLGIKLTFVIFNCSLKDYCEKVDRNKVSGL